MPWNGDENADESESELGGPPERDDRRWEEIGCTLTLESDCTGAVCALLGHAADTAFGRRPQERETHKQVKPSNQQRQLKFEVFFDLDFNIMNV